MNNGRTDFILTQIQFFLGQEGAILFVLVMNETVDVGYTVQSLGYVIEINMVTFN